jgi:hypothetical protein
MKKFILLFAFFLFLNLSLKSQEAKPAGKVQHCIVQIYGSGMIRGAYLVFDDMTTEKREVPTKNHEEYLKFVMEIFKSLKEKGYSFVSSTATVGNIMFAEYIFKKE